MNYLHAGMSVFIIMCLAKGGKCASLENIHNSKTDLDQETVLVRETKIRNSNELRFNLHAFGENIRLILFKNDQLATPQAQVIRRHNGHTVSRGNFEDYYTGYIQSRPGSSLALKVENGSLSGVITLDSNLMTIRSLNEPCGVDGAVLHVITRHENNTLQGDASSLSSQHPTRTKRSTAGPARYVEVMLVSDRYTTEAYGNFTEQYLMSVAYLLNAVMQDDSIGQIKVFYTVVKIMVISGYEKGLDLAENEIDSSIEYLSVFATWSSQFNSGDDSDPKHFDQAILITKKVCGLQASGCFENGRGYYNQMCSGTRSVASAIAAGLSAALTAAHETGHNFGLSHDSGDCANGYIMHAALASGKNAFSWSSCSRTKLQTAFSDSSKFSCLNDVPSGVDTSEVVSVINVAKNYSGDDQCRLMYGEKYTHCGALKSNCKTLYCRPSGENFCIHRSTPPLEGTECGTYKWCRNGECVDQPIPDPIDGGWSSWSQTHTDCNRRCGMGIRYRTRTCDNPTPEFFGKACEGASKGHYETCNTHDCPVGTDSFRQEQCEQIKLSYTEYLIASTPCLLRCREGNSVKLLHVTAKDGTLCSQYKDERDVCVLGECKKVGCDRTFDRKFYDRCRVCSGNGTTCRLVKSSYDKVHRGTTGPTTAGVMFTLPVGSANVLVQETSNTYNNIGLKDKDDKWIIDDNSNTGTRYAAGSRITFERAGSASAEKMVINGPTTEILKVMFIYWFESNKGVPYEYYEPLTTPDTTPLTFKWKYTLSECSETCAGGVKTKITTCHRMDDDSEVGLGYCDANTEPTDTEPCNTQACDPSWHADPWSSCSASCGPTGTRSRKVECRQKQSADVTAVLSDNRCSETKPVDSEDCNRDDCPPDWVPAEWSVCSKNKCQGIQTRSLSCKKMLVTGVVQDADDSECTGERPLTELICNDGVYCHDWRPVYPSCTECQDYFETEVSSRTPGGSQHKKVGCYKIKTKPFGSMLSRHNTGDDAAKVAECGRVAWGRARRMFAVSSGGECYSSMNAHRVYHRDGPATDCPNNTIGGAESVYVYALIGKVLVSTPTCFSVEDDVPAADSNCESIATKPPPEIKVCCEDMCKDNCFRTKTAGKYCSIPFIYRGKTFYECIRNDQGRMWCATTSNYDVDGQGAECEEPCRQRTTSGECCSFPFIYRGRLYNTCTGSAPQWCALTSSYDRDRLRGTCV